VFIAVVLQALALRTSLFKKSAVFFNELARITCQFVLKLLSLLRLAT